MASGGMEGLTPEAARSLVDSVDVFIFDCDGVIWKGDKLIEGVSEALHTLRSLGKRFVFVTNNSRKSRKQYAKKFSKLGMEIDEGEIFTSSFAAAMYLKLNNFPTDKKVYVVGEEGIKEELKLVGYESIGGPEDGRKSIQLESSFFFDHDRSVGAVVVGLDQHFNYYKLQYATLCIRENPGCLFIATNCDSSGNLTSLQEWPGAGCMVSAVSCSTQKEPVVVGKPSTFLMKFLLERFKIDVSRMCMVGDRLDTDILFGQNTGCKTLLVLSGYFAFLYQVSLQGVQIRCRSYYGALYDQWWSHMDPGVGVTTLPALLDPSNSIYPDVYANNLSHFVQLSSL